MEKIYLKTENELICNNHWIFLSIDIWKSAIGEGKQGNQDGKFIHKLKKILGNVAPSTPMS